MTNDQTDVVIREATDADAVAWDEFIKLSKDATFFHLFGWREIFAKVFRLSPRYLIAERAGDVCGILPLVQQKSLLFGNNLCAAPFCVEGGPIGLGDAIVKRLDQAAIAVMREIGASSLEYRSRTASREDWKSKPGLYATFKKDIVESEQENLNAIPRKQRAVLRKAIQGNLAGEIDPEVDAFFRVYSESMRNLGTPMFPKAYFKKLQAVFGSAVDIVVIKDGSIPVSAVLNFYFRDTVMPYYGGGTTLARRNGANDLLYWEVLCRAAARGYRTFDFGRSKAGTGAYSFKKNWGFEPHWLEYEYFLPEGGKLPDKNPNNPIYARFISAWKRLPVPLANLLGPMLIGGLG